jgi:hypothetical protein
MNDNTKIKKDSSKIISNIQNNLLNEDWILMKLAEISNYEPNEKLDKSISLETKIIIQQCKIGIIESFWNYFLKNINISNDQILYYKEENHLILININSLANYDEAIKLANKYGINNFAIEDENEIDILLSIANKFWLDLVNKEIKNFETNFLQNIDSSNRLYLLRELYIKLESYYLFEIEKESWTGNLEQEFAPLFKIFFRGIKYEKDLMNSIEIDEFIDLLYKSLRHEAISNTNNFIFSDSDFNDYQKSCPIHLKEESIKEINAKQISSHYDSTILGCPAIYSKIELRYKHNQLLKDIFYWQMDIYKQIIILYSKS